MCVVRIASHTQNEYERHTDAVVILAVRYNNVRILNLCHLSSSEILANSGTLQRLAIFDGNGSLTNNNFVGNLFNITG